MPMTPDNADESSPLLGGGANETQLVVRDDDGWAQSLVEAGLSKEDQLMGQSTVGERLPYNDYTTIDWLHDLVRTRNCLSCWSSNV